jgi:tRNA nucleotidyltransferase (CCA-adding enzyme)
MRKDKVVGVVTRSDLLRALEEPHGEGADDADVSIADRLDALEHLRPVFEAVQAVSESFDGVYLVGGAVRDVLMGEPNFDVDIAVEGDGITLGRALARVLGGRMVPHEKFGTAVVLYGEGGRIDVATARTEFYDHPGALPAVERASIRQDLYRRDFTINAMAASLRGEDFGRLVDYFGGYRDLQERVIRVLHNLSFIDDPTRIFRAIRYENRYGFRMDAHTLSLARACVEMELVGELSSARLRDELQDLLSEERVTDSVRRLAELGIDRAVHPRLAADDEAARLIEQVDALRKRYAPSTPPWRPRLAVLARKMSSTEVLDWADRLKLRRRDGERIADAVTVAPRLRQLVAGIKDAAELRAVVEPHDPDGALFALAEAKGKAAKQLTRYFEELRGVRLEISGGDLVALGLGESPRVGAVLDELLRRKLNGQLDGRNAELEAARELLKT